MVNDLVHRVCTWFYKESCYGISCYAILAYAIVSFGKYGMLWYIYVMLLDLYMYAIQ